MNGMEAVEIARTLHRRFFPETDSVIKVDKGRGFIIEHRALFDFGGVRRLRRKLVVTASHCLPHAPKMPCYSYQEWDDPRAVDYEFCHSHSVHLPKAFNASVLRKPGRTFKIQKVRPQLQKRGRAEQTAREKDACAVENPRQVRPPSISWNRVELYDEVWNQPLVKLSRKYGISDVRLGKVCRKLKIPHPGRGYWAKRSVGQTVAQVPLPEFKDAPVVKRLIRKPKGKIQRGGKIVPQKEPCVNLCVNNF